MRHMEPCRPKSELLTHSRLVCGATCPRKEYYEYYCLVRPEPTDTLRIGGAFHAAIEMAKAGKTYDECVVFIDENYFPLVEGAVDDDLAHKLESEATKVKAMVFGWIAMYINGEANDVFGKLKIVENEQTFSVAVRNPDTGMPSRNWKLGGKRDAIVQREDHPGQRWLLEHKTTSESIDPESDYWLRLRIDQQLSLYMNAAREQGKPLAGALYDVVHVPATMPVLVNEVDEKGMKIVVDKETKKRVYKPNGEPYQSAGRPEHEFLRRRETQEEYWKRLVADMDFRRELYFARREFSRTTEDLQEAADDLWSRQQQLTWCYRHGRWPKNTAACRFPFKCAFLSVCANHTDLNKVVPDGFVRLTTPHPELE